MNLSRLHQGLFMKITRNLENHGNNYGLKQINTGILSENLISLAQKKPISRIEVGIKNNWC